MKKLICLLAFAALYSCADEFELPEQTQAVAKDKKETSRIASNPFTLDVATSGLIQGVVSDAIALQNRNTMNTIITTAVGAGYDGLVLDALDCFFVVGSNAPYNVNNTSINIPNHFSLIMSENTHLRVQPNNHKNYSLLSIKDKEDIGIEGGNLHGERRNHTFLSSSSDEWGHLLTIVSGVSVEVNGTHFYEANGDGISISSSQFSTDANYNPSREILIQNCLLDSNRRSNISITNGNTIAIDHCTFKDAGINLATSSGTAPRMSINIEATRHRDPNNNMVLDEHAYNIQITNNTETCANYGGFHVSIGEQVTITDNTTQANIGFYFTSQTTISRNHIERPAPSTTGTTVGISAGGSSLSDTVWGNTISDNFIKNYSIGINVYQQDAQFLNNTIDECLAGIQVKDIRNCLFQGNKIRNQNRSNAKGIAAGWTYLDGVDFIKNEIIGNFEEAVYFYQFNQTAGTENYKLGFNSNSFDCTGKVHFTSGRGLDFKLNGLSTNVYLSSMTNSKFVTNKISMPPTESQNGLLIADSDTVEILDNSIFMQSSNTQKCIYAINSIHLLIGKNKLRHSNGTTTLWVNNVDYSEVKSNLGEIGAVEWFMRASNCDHITFSINRAQAIPFDRSQFINCTNYTVMP